MSVQSKIIMSCLLGNILEWFDFTIYAYVVPLIAPQLMPPSNTTSALMITYSIFAIGFLVRPVGAVIFGTIGDRLGRKTALVLSSLMMCFSTVSIGFLPGYEKIGIFAPILLLSFRILQSLAVGGEFTGSMVYLVEHAPAGRKGFFSSWTDMGCTLGVILGSSCIIFLTNYFSTETFLEYGWRIPFFSGILLGFLSMYIRITLKEPQEFLQSKKEVLPIKVLFQKMPKNLLYATCLITINTLGFYILTVYIPNQNVISGKLTISESYTLNNIILMIFLCSGFISALLSDYLNFGKIYVWGTVGCFLLSYPMFYAMNHFAMQTQMFYLGSFAFLLGCCFGPRPLFLMKVFPPAVRFSGIAICLSLGNGIFGGTAPLLATYLTSLTGTTEVAALLIMIAAGLTLFSIYKLNKILGDEEKADDEKEGVSQFT